MARLPDNYFGPKQRVTKLKEDYPKAESSIKTEVSLTVLDPETVIALVKATIEVDGKVLAQGHAFTAELDEHKALEKAETVAVGRALIHAGYPELSDDEEEEESKPAYKTTKKPTGLGTPRKAPAEEESEEVAEEEAPKPKARGLGVKRKPIPKPEVVEEEEATNDEEEPTKEESSEKEVEVKPKKMTREELLAKYKKR